MLYKIDLSSILNKFTITYERGSRRNISDPNRRKTNTATGNAVKKQKRRIKFPLKGFIRQMSNTLPPPPFMTTKTSLYDQNIQKGL